MTPSRAYCTALTSRSPRPFPCRVCGCPLGKNCSLNVFLSEYSYFTDFQCFGLGRKLRYISSYPCVTNLRLWGHIFSVDPETSLMEEGARFRLNIGHHRSDPLVT